MSTPPHQCLPLLSYALGLNYREPRQLSVYKVYSQLPPYFTNSFATLLSYVTLPSSVSPHNPPLGRSTGGGGEEEKRRIRGGGGGGEVERRRRGEGGGEKGEREKRRRMRRLLALPAKLIV